MAQSLPRMPDELLMDAFTDAALLGPDGTPLFGTNLVTIKLGGDAGINDQSGTLTLPLAKIVLTVGSAYMRDILYAAPDPNDTSGRPITDCEATVPFTVWASSAENLSEMRRRLLYARDHLGFVFSLHGMTLLGQVVPERKRPFDPNLGLFAEDYRWHFSWSRS